MIRLEPSNRFDVGVFYTNDRILNSFSGPNKPDKVFGLRIKTTQRIPDDGLEKMIASAFELNGHSYDNTLINNIPLYFDPALGFVVYPVDSRGLIFTPYEYGEYEYRGTADQTD